MAAPFCTACGATIAGGTRFCVKCGQPVGQAAPPPPPPPPPADLGATLVMTPLPPQAAQFPPAPDPAGYYPAAEPVQQGSGAGIWLGLIGLVLLAAGGGVYLYMTRGPGFQAASTPVAAAPAQPATPVAAPPPEVIPPNPDYAKPEAIPPNPDFAKKDGAPAPSSPPAQPKPKPAINKSSNPSPPSAPPAQPVRAAAAPTSGTLHAAVEVGLNGEVVFENLPNGRLRFIYDHSAWRPTISHQANGTQTLVMRSLKAGIQRVCDVQWEIVQ
jgi:hypothetical protein